MRLVLIGCFLALVGATLARNTWQDDKKARKLFQEFKNKYNKNYNGYDNEKRFAIFKDNLKKAEDYQKNELGTAEYGVTQFSDLTSEEFRARFANARFEQNTKHQLTYVKDVSDLPESFDWRHKGAVGPVEDQGSCGSCWAFSVTGNVEGQWFKKTGNFVTLSKQELVDCDRQDYGCDGGYPPVTYQEIMRLGGMEAQKDYPYVGRNEECHLDSKKIVAKIDGFLQLETSETAQAKYLAEHGPLSVALNADPLQFYQGGIMKPSYCPADGMNHAVLSVGYGVENGQPYWLIRNSWGPNWAEQGYFRIHRGDGTCGINMMATSAVIN